MQVELNGKLRSLRLDGYAHTVFRDIAGTNLIPGYDGSVAHIVYLVYAVMKSGARFHKEEFDETWIDVAQWDDFQKFEKITDLGKSLQELIKQSFPQEKNPEKKRTGKASR